MDILVIYLLVMLRSILFYFIPNQLLILDEAIIPTLLSFQKTIL
jgi:hypothetical protein